MPESFNTKLQRWGFNFFPAYRGTGARITYIAGDWREIRIKLPLNWRTRNYVGTIYGGSMYAAVDPIYMVMLIKILGPDYVVWDKSAAIRFKRPGRSTLYARFVLDEQEVEAIRSELKEQASVNRVYSVDLTDDKGAVHATVEKTIYIRFRQAGQSNQVDSGADAQQG
jgi:acyl-coenzyme A thioesterase PaaI-like protein